jgi:formamidopyrimidine-DNA glycosylase
LIGVPELPDIVNYIEALGERVVGEPIEKVRVASPFLVRSVDPPLRTIEGRRITGLRRIGKRIVWELEGDLFVVLHLMIAGRLRWRERGVAVPRKVGLAAFDFPRGSLLFTEASKKKRASLVVVRGGEALAALDPGGIEVIGIDPGVLAAALRHESHTIKRVLTDPRVLSGIGNAYSDEILHRARVSPVKLTSRLDDDEIGRVHRAIQDVLGEWTERLRQERAGEFPETVTAFHDQMAVHGRYKKPCPACGTLVQRIVRGEHEVNYCPACQTDGKLLADRALSRLIHDWPKTLEEMEERKARASMPTAPAAPPKATPAKAAPAKATPAKAAAVEPERPLLLFAPGAGAPSSSEWMRRWARRLERLGRVVPFDYPYMRDGKKRPDAHDALVAAHAAALEAARSGHEGPVVLVGKSMGGRIGCHLALEQPVAGLVCLGYPLVGAGKSKPVRDEVLLALRAPVLFVQGDRDPMCPLDRLADVRARMKAPSSLFVVENGDHSLEAQKTWLRAQGKTQDDVDARIAEAIAVFLATLRPRARLARSRRRG